MKLLLAYFVSCLVMAGVSGCSSAVKIPVSVQRPAETDLSAYKLIALGNFQGNLGGAFYERIKQGLVESPSHFQVLDRSRLDQVLRELRLSQSDLVDTRHRVKVGRLLGASALITGWLNSTYSEGVQSYQLKCRSQVCMNYQTTGVLRISGSMDVIDLQTGQILKSKMMNDTCQDSAWSMNGPPVHVDANALAEKCLSKQVNIFMRSVSIWSEVIDAPFEKDSALPGIDRGIAYARAGDMSEAANIFSSTARASENSRSVGGKSIATAYWNAGLAYLYMNEYDNAIDSFKKAFSFNQDEKYLQEKMRVEYLKRDRQKLDAQLGNNL